MTCNDRRIVAFRLAQSFVILNRVVRITDQEVTGSTPVGRTSFDLSVQVFPILFSTFFSYWETLDFWINASGALPTLGRPSAKEGSKGFLAVAVEEGHVDPAAFVGILKLDDVGFVEKVGIEDHCPVLPVWNIERFCPAFF